MFYYILLITLIPTLAISIPYGTVSEAQLITVGAASIWLYNQSSWSQCMCQALQYTQPSIVAFNIFLNNKTCQLIPNTYSSNATFYIMSSQISIIYILTENFIYQLKSICCSDISWLINKIQQSNTFHKVNITQPVGLALDYDLNMLILTYGSRRSIQQREATINMTGKKSLFTKTNAQPISYHDRVYYVGINPSISTSSYYFYTYNTTLSRIFDMPVPEGDPQRAIWLHNNSIMCLIIQKNQTSTLVFLNWYPSSLNYTYNQTILVPFNKPYGLAKSNDDTMIYVSGDTATIYQLSTKTFLWSVLVSNDNSTEIPMSLFVDSCGNRLWVLMLGFGIRVYDRIYGGELASWNMSMTFPTLYDMILTSGYELFLVDYSTDQLIHYGSSLKEQCTINTRKHFE
ncbi:unnamed protein product [Rotaria sp. Silwood2]|nr:unnamed protein product [Rotaria sp. Silwood2]CAF3138290.1 unnamed protein product [Rotaria sp. Silwood2]CAF4553761.1 unnamed protein product [Rotaria sp. Silwood2]CAF4619822.1 unnamed protein product [Rotaria sp. Silwood2]